MITIIKNVEVYSPKYLGKKDVLLFNDRIEKIEDKIMDSFSGFDVQVIDGQNKKLFPGFIDSHVHIIGGGGEGGFKTRTPEVQISHITTGGVTTVVGCIGTDGICRNMRSLIAKAKALEEEGITTYCYTGSYEVPVKFMTDSIKGDLMLVDKVIGVGEIALSDHRSSQPSFHAFVDLVAQARVGGLLSGKAGVVNVHLGNGKSMLEFLIKVITETEIPPSNMIPTHVNRNDELFKKGVEYAKMGGFIDFTTSCDPKHLEKGELRAGEALKKALDEGVDIKHITFTSDGNGSMPLFDESGKLAGLGICSIESLYREIKDAIINEGVPIEDAIKVVTENVAELLKLHTKGRIKPGMDGDLVIVDKDLNIDTVIAKGKLMINEGEVLVKGTFENSI